jgi:hypothetical protein
MTDPVDRRSVRCALALAAAAPSVHNSQPWRWVVGRHMLHLYADLGRWLPTTDPQGRDMIVSCGAALHHARVALAAAGLASSVRRVPVLDEPDHLASLKLHPRPADDTALTLAAAILRRRTDRRPFTDWEVPAAFVDELTDRATGQGALLRPVTTTWSRARLIDVMRAADGQQVDVLGKRAIVARRLADVGAPARRFGDIEQSPNGQPDGAVLMVLATASDDALSHLRAGEALSAVSLHATELGLATCALSEPFEAGSARHVVQDEVLDGCAVPQLLLRVGWAPAGTPVRPTPRRQVDDMIEPF